MPHHFPLQPRKEVDRTKLSPAGVSGKEQATHAKALVRIGVGERRVRLANRNGVREFRLKMVADGGWTLDKRKSRREPFPINAKWTSRNFDKVRQVQRDALPV